MEFIPAKESSLFTSLFKWYTLVLFKRRFHRVWIRQSYRPGENDKTVYYLNHHSWWDGLIPFLLNEFRFRQKARALMEDRQMRHYPFFKKIGAFSVDRENSRKAIYSLRYAVQSMKRGRASLFIYPEGKITPAGTPMAFEGGLSWLYSRLDADKIDFVPVAIGIYTFRHDKPELYIRVGEAANIPRDLAHNEVTGFLEDHLQRLLDETTASAVEDENDFELFVR